MSPSRLRLIDQYRNGWRNEPLARSMTCTTRGSYPQSPREDTTSLSSLHNMTGISAPEKNKIPSPSLQSPCPCAPHPASPPRKPSPPYFQIKNTLPLFASDSSSLILPSTQSKKKETSAKIRNLTYSTCLATSWTRSNLYIAYNFQGQTSTRATFSSTLVKFKLCPC